MNLLRDEDGQTLALVALCMTALLGFTALAVDVGQLFRTRRNMQIAADAAAVAGALDYKYNTTGQPASAKSAGQAAAVANGVTNGIGGASVTINVPPVNGPYAGDSGFVEAIVTSPGPTSFMGVFTHSNSINVSARSVAGSGTVSGCVWTLARSGTDVSLTGSAGITATNCDIYDDSSSTTALTLTGSGSITAKAIGIVGSSTDTGSGRISPSPQTGMSPAADPLAGLQAPSIPTGVCSSSCNPNFSGSSSNTLGPGTYTSISNTGSGNLTLTAGNYIINGNLSNTGSGSLTLGAGNYTITGNFTDSGAGALTLGAGLYIVGGNLSLTGSGSLTANSITFYTEGSNTVTGSGGMTLTAPTSGALSGVLFFQARGDTNPIAITGSGSSTVQGIVYAPDSPLTMTGSGSMTISTDLIVDSLSVTGSGSLTNTNYAAVTNTSSVLSKLTMVE